MSSTSEASHGAGPGLLISHDGRGADRIGFIASTLCAVHCLAGLMLAGASGMAPIFEDGRVETAFAVVAVSIALVALVRGRRWHAKWTPIIAGVPGVLVLGAAHLAPSEGRTFEVVTSVAGGALLATAHALNPRELRNVGACCKERGPEPLLRS